MKFPALGRQFPQDLLDYIVRTLPYVHPDMGLIIVRFFERCQLGLQERGWHVFVTTACEPPGKDGRVPREIDEHQPGGMAAQQVAVASLQGGAGDDGHRLPMLCAVAGAALGKRLPDFVEPGNPVFVIQWRAGGHFGLVDLRVEVIAVGKRKAQAFRQHCSNGRFSAP